MRITLLALAFLAALGACDAVASDEGGFLRLDAQRSSGSFRVKLVWLFGINGEFGEIDGEIHRNDFRNSLRVDARIDARTLRMSNARYENWAKSEDFFDVARHPQLSFASDEFARLRLRDGGALVGQLTVRGITRPVRFELLPAQCEHPAFDCPIRVNGTIRRSQFGMTGHRGTLADKVELDFSIFVQATAARDALAPG
ncbi:MAG: YceI family protein [Dokdonella sp.]|uniref:YceI family protein n=1 Tax=Dokdonella sp. TaxID=2291710 RepID=UPI0025C71931|nr:YceI family protein [Dokdonella sp.]MBZ0224190.1 YceI family protein [Dokdonella sp.]